jgi:hypothetical protein
MKKFLRESGACVSSKFHHQYERFDEKVPDIALKSYENHIKIEV